MFPDKKQELTFGDFKKSTTVLFRLLNASFTGAIRVIPFVDIFLSLDSISAAWKHIENTFYRFNHPPDISCGKPK